MSRVWFDWRADPGVHDIRQYARDLERRIQAFSQRIDALSGVTINRVTNIEGGGTVGDELPEDISLVAAQIGTSTEGSPLDHVHFFNQDLLDVDALLDDYSITAGAGLTGGGTLDTSPTIDVVALDSTIVVEADGIRADVAALSPLTTKGDLWGYDTGNTRVSVGTDDFLLFSDSLDAQGVAWKDPIVELNGAFDHGALLGLGDSADHAWAFLHDGSRAATGNFDLDANDILNIGDLEIDRVGQSLGAWFFMKADLDQSILVEMRHGANRVWRDRIVPTTGDRQFGAYDSGTDAAIDVPITIRRAAGGDIDLERRLDMQTNDIVNVGDSLQFDVASTPIIDQEDATGSNDGAEMIVRSQLGGPTGETTGGNLRLIGAEGTVGEGGGPGTVHVECGTGTVVASFGDASVNFFERLFMNAEDIDAEGGDILLGGGDVNGEYSGGAGGARLFSFMHLQAGGLDVSNTQSGVADGATTYITDGDAGAPCLAIWYNSAWRVAVSDLSALTVVSAT